MTITIVPPKAEYDRRNEAEFRAEVERNIGLSYDKRGDLIVPLGKRLAFTSPQGQVITFGYNNNGEFTVQQDANSPFGLASISYVSSVETSLEGQIAVLEVDVEAANDAAAAAASSAISAQTSETNAGNSATAAQTSATSASTSASNAATSATNASNSASNASTSASQASTSASNAAGSASAASTSATNASNSATSAGNSATAASTSASQAATSATNAGASEAAASTSATNAATSATNASNSASAASTSASNASTSATNAGNSATSAQNSATSASTQASNAATSASQASTSASNAATSASQASTSASNAAGSASTASTQATNAANSATSAGNSASAASTSASNASTSATNASTSASAAQTSATNAAASATNAASSASTATTQASNASASAASASASSTLSATFASGSQGSINSSATFADNANATGVPTNWIDWANGAANITRVTGLSPQMYAITITGVAGSNTGIQQYHGGKVTQGWHVLEYDVTLNSGTFVGAGGHLNWGPSGVINASVDLSFAGDLDITGVAPGNGTTGKLYKFRKLINVNSASDIGFIYAMAHYSGLGSVAAANSITFHRVALRAASQAEIEARQAKNDIDTPTTGLKARATLTETRVSAVETGKADASTVTTLTSQVNASDSNESLLANPFFRQSFTNGNAPTGWTADSSQVNSQYTARPYGLPGYCYFNSTTNFQTIIFQVVAGGVYPGGKYKLGAQIARGSGTLGTAGLICAWYTDADVFIEYSLLRFSTEPRTDGVTSATPDRVVRYEKEITAPANAYRARIYAATGWGGWGAIEACGIYWLEVIFDPASIAESGLRTEAATRASADSANSSLITALTAKVNVNGNRFPHPQPLSTTLPSGWGGPGLVVGTWEPLGGYFYYKARGSGGAATTEWFYYDVEATNSAYIDTNQQYTLSAVGYGGSGSSGDRLMMRIELFDSGGNIIHASPYVLLNGYGPERASTTTSYVSGGDYVRRRVVFQREWAASGSYQDIVFNYIKLERGPTATAYTADGSGISLQAGVTTNASAIATVDGKLTASYGLTVDANGRIASMKLLSNGTTSSVKFTADTFQIFNGSTDVAPFEVTGGQVKIKSANVGTLNIGSGGLTIQSGSSGARIVISNSVVEVYDATRLRVRLGIW